MSGQREHIERLLAEMERESRESYARGWNDAIAALQAKAPKMDAPARTPAPTEHAGGNGSGTTQRQRGRPEKAITFVQEAIFSEPGLRGVDIVRTLERNGTPVVDRTVRSALRRLREGKVIWERRKRWYPKSKEHTEDESGFGEAVGSPPH
jgi:hypothetical protein